jgi:MinD superfamily P-loop ATPase
MTSSKNIRIAVASGKGGTGKTLLSTNLFHTLRVKGEHVTLVDCDAEEPNDLMFFSIQSSIRTTQVTQKVPVIDESKCNFCGKCHEYCSYNAIFIIPPSKIIKVMEDLCHGCGACTVACKHKAISEKDVLLGEVNVFQVSENASIIESRVKVGVYSPVSVIKKAIKIADNQSIVIFDSPPGTSCPFIQTVAKADYVILVTEPTPFGLSDLRQSVETLRTMYKECGVVVNRAGLGNRDVYKYLEQENIPLLMEIPFDREIAMAYSKGQLLAQNKPEFQEELYSMINRIINDFVGNDIT